MNDLTLDIAAEYTPEMALILYGCKGRLDSYYIESRPIINGEMAAGAPLTENVLEGIVKFLKPKERKIEDVVVGGIIPPNLLSFSRNNAGTEMTWYRKPEKRTMYFKESLHIPDGEAMVPGLVYQAKGNGLRVYALRSNVISDKSVLFQPPFHNCSTDGNVCLGTAKVRHPDKMTYEALMKYYEQLFWGSKFSHNGASGASGNLNLIWKNQIANPEQAFDVKLLIPTKKKLKDIL